MENQSAPEGTSTPGILHYVSGNICAFEPTKALVRSMNINTLVWVGGMFDTLGSTAYPFTLAQSLGPAWSLVTCSLGSAGMSWGVKSIATDAQDLAKIISYLKAKRPDGKILIMGHSTGCQDCMEYLVGKGNEQRQNIDGVILQAPCSDREALEKSLPEAHKDEADQLAHKMCREGQDKDALPNRLTKPVFGRLAITARRWCDISSPGPDHTGADDYFSSDLPVGRFKGTFGKLPPSTPLLILMSGSDEFVPEKVDKDKLSQTWTAIVKEGGGNVDDTNGGVVPRATHAYTDIPDGVVQDMVKRVLGFIQKIDEGNFGTSTARI